MFVMKGGAFPQEWASPLWKPDDYLQLPGIEFGWLAYSPYYRPLIDRLPGPNAFLALGVETETYLVVREGDLPFISRYMAEHHGLDVAFTIEHTIIEGSDGTAVRIYSLVVKQQEAEEP
jgi:hypothetical protein